MSEYEKKKVEVEEKIKNVTAYIKNLKNQIERNTQSLLKCRRGTLKGMDSCGYYDGMEVILQGKLTKAEENLRHQKAKLRVLNIKIERANILKF